MVKYPRTTDTAMNMAAVVRERTCLTSFHDCAYTSASFFINKYLLSQNLKPHQGGNFALSSSQEKQQYIPRMQRDAGNRPQRNFLKISFSSGWHLTPDPLLCFLVFLYSQYITQTILFNPFLDKPCNKNSQGRSA